MEILSERDSFYKLIQTAFNRSIRIQNTEISAGTTVYNPKMHKLLEYVYDNDVRKGGVTPSIEHPYAVANLILNEVIILRDTDKIIASTQNIGFHINDLLNLIAIALLHDVVEDYAAELGIKINTTSETFDLNTQIDMDYIKIIHNYFNPLLLLCNHRNGSRIPPDLYYGAMIHNELVCVTKLADRLHNTLSLIEIPEVVTEKIKLIKQQDFDRYYGRLKDAVTTPLFAAIANRLYAKLEVATNNLIQLKP